MRVPTEACPVLPTNARAVPLQLHQNAKPVRQEVSRIWIGVQDLERVQPPDNAPLTLQKAA